MTEDKVRFYECTEGSDMAGPKVVQLQFLTEVGQVMLHNLSFSKQDVRATLVCLTQAGVARVSLQGLLYSVSARSYFKDRVFILGACPCAGGCVNINYI